MNLFNHFLFYKKLKLIITELMRLFENIVFFISKAHCHYENYTMC